MSTEAVELKVVPEFDQVTQNLAVLEWLSSRRGIASVAIVIRVDEELFRTLPEGDEAVFQITRQCTMRAVDKIKERWRRLVPNTPWTRIRAYPNIGACILHGPVGKLRQFFDSTLARDVEGPIRGLLFGEPLATPETLEAEEVHVEALKQTIESFGRECYEIGRRGEAPGQVEEICRSEVVMAAAASGWLGSFDWGARPNPLDVLAQVRSPDDYINGLGIGDAGRWESYAGRGQTICVIDSGADESHPCLQEQVRHYLRYDLYGNEKEAYACMDHACHGTKVSGWIAGRYVSRSELGCDLDGLVRLGIAPGSKLFVISALNGDFMRETGSILQLVAALESAVQRRESLGHSIANISVEVSGEKLQPGTSEVFDLLLGHLKRCGIVPILAAGNRGRRSGRLGTYGCYVGAADSDGRPWSKNGPNPDLLAPGIDLLSAHPRSPRLNDLFLGLHSGTSIASAIAAGAVAIISAAKGISASEALERLKVTSRDGFINIDDALAWS